MVFIPARTFDQEEDIQLFHVFATKYSAAMPEVNKTFMYIETSQFNKPFSIINNLVFFNRTICERLRFTTEELEAMLAHQVGHAVDSLVRTKVNQSEREDHADDFAVAQNLGCFLCSALKKCYSSGVFSDPEVDVIAAE